ncbi:ABC-three component system middle component 5 [Photobacterium alginatilyticum]|uniref:Uncharacterized protein n=1 Tax=Photobacterium alginatilyticum TaxID=1775171 RepID=A0ABW9YQQ3_9GAMM|nr:ABC-three component system middle component 5 [Photobacterium alginatilyticum]NBI56105.1 hypothetical protein [Photobacterium alginatilyticum]
MIIYHPYKDANHCAYRIISILVGCSTPVNINYLHIADFYHLFPCQLKSIDRWPRKGSNNHRIINKIEDAYERLENPRRMFFELKTIRRNVIINLLSRNLVEYTRDNLIKLKQNNLPQDIVNLLDKDQFRKSAEFKLITENMRSLKLYGESGLKSKSGLMEYRYDVSKA